MAKQGKHFVVNTQPTKQFVVESLTKDVTVEACIFDLIDNSIDAARNRLFDSADENETRDLPDSFAEFKVVLQIDASGLKIEDNCGGIPISSLRDMVLRYGRASAHKLGIGVYGVGLNRAIFKLGKVTHLKTDTGVQRAELVLKSDDYMADDDDWGLPAEEFASTSVIGTELEIRQPSDEISQELGDTEFIDDIREEIGWRYGRFLARGLVIVVNGDHVVAQQIALRENGPFPIENKFYRTESGVAVYLKVGEHAQHRFQGEDGYDKEANKRLTGEYGWTVFCNDRAILIADTTRTVGWDTRFHSEFYGFVASVSFVASDPSKLPWLTSKADVDLNNAAYKMALEDMRKFNEGWRQFTERYKKIRKGDQSLAAIPPAPTVQGFPPPAPPKSGDRGVVPRPVVKAEVDRVGHNDLRFVLPADINEHHCNDKFLEIVREAKTLDIGTHSYTALALLRMLFEFSVTHYMIRVNKGAELKAFAIALREKNTERPVVNSNSFSPKLEEVLAFLDENPDTWGPLASNHVKHSIGNLKKHVTKMNEALHNPFTAIHRSLVFQIRDEGLHALRHLIEQPYPIV